MVMSKQDKTDYKRKFNAENYSRVGLYLKEDVKKALDAHIAKTKESMNGFINQAIIEKLARDSEATPGKGEDHGQDIDRKSH